MDIKLFNIAAVSRRIKVTPQYCQQLITGARTTEKRLQQIAGVLEMSLPDLKLQIQNNHKNGHADKHAMAHSQTHRNRFNGRNPRARNLTRVAA